ncbi:MAG: c-type cytochrome [Caldilineaceae bacterium SB0668_bin_21]|nr:c-type cytochrome [Caldilineaceae bacterium SB0668_bin_21]MYC20809.1 c-type cytochrome [Caldilineaceae bacterium SB0662_bin_25]
MIEASYGFAGEGRVFDPDPPTKRTHLYELQLLTVELERFRGDGGAIEPLGDNLLLVTPRGQIALIQAEGRVDYLPDRVPMSETSPAEEIGWVGFRVADILLNEESPEEFTLFVSHHYLVGECVEFRISSTRLNLGEREIAVSGEWTTEFTANPCLETAIFGNWEGDIPKVGGGIQAGGRMLMDGDRHLLVAVGDHAWYEWHVRNEGGDPERPPVVDPDTHLGKLVRIELESGRNEIVATGFRNPQGLARDAEGKLWLTEHGPQGGDELNLVWPGLDYGWPFATYGILYGDRIWPYNEEQGRHDGSEEPFYAWIPAIAVSNLIVSDSEQFPLWRDDLLVGSLRSGSLFRVRIRQERVTNIERIGFGERIRDIAQTADGRVALLTDSSKVILLQRAPLYCQLVNDPRSIFSFDAEEVCIDVFSLVDEDVDALIRGLEGTDIGIPAMRSQFEVFVHENLLIYLRIPCSTGDFRNRFFLHITPVHAQDISEELKQFGFNVYDFNSFDRGVGSTVFEGGCLVVRTLPAYEIKHIYTGQVIREESPDGEVFWRGPVWEGSYTFGTPYLARAPADEAPPFPAQDEGASDPGAGLFTAFCAGCHRLSAEHSAGPHLAGVIGRRAGSVAGFEASAAVSGLDIVWTRENLAEFIENPTQFAPGTTMTAVGVTPEEARMIAEFLALER